VLAAAWMMYSGAVISLLSTVVNLAIIGEIKNAFLNKHPYLPANGVSAANATAGAFAVAYLVGGGIAIALWLWLASAAKRGAGWARTVGTVLFGIHTVITVATLGTQGIGLTKAIAVVVWLIALAAVIFLWQRASSVFFGRR